MADFEGRVVIITGAGGGSGSRIVQRWIDEGASVLAVDATERGASRFQESDRLRTLVADLATPEGADQMVAQAEAHFGTPDSLIHLAGGFGMGSILADDAQANWDKMLTINLQTAFHAFRAVIPAFQNRGGGWIVAMGSRAVQSPPAQMSAYTAAKAALMALAGSISEEVKKDNIHVNVVIPSTIDTPANREAMGEPKPGQWVTADDVADATMYLCSERARSVYGATLELFARS